MEDVIVRKGARDIRERRDIREKKDIREQRDIREQKDIRERKDIRPQSLISIVLVIPKQIFGQCFASSYSSIGFILNT